MSRLNRIEGLVKMGGFKAVLAKLSDTLTGSNYTNGYLYTLQKTTDPKEYRNLLENYYMYRTGEKLNLDHPKTFNEKIQWLKLYDSMGNKTRLADKYLVREWVREKIGEEYLVPLLGVWDSFDEIDFNALPNQFALKCNHGSGWNLIVEDKNTLNVANAKRLFDKWMSTNYAFCAGFELQYRDIKPQIIAEEYIDFDTHGEEYQFWCFNGEPAFVSVIRDPHGENQKATYDLQWRELPFITSLPGFLEEERKNLNKPKQFGKMIDIAQKASRGFRFSRVDLYKYHDRIYIAEMTFTPASGFCKWYPAEYDLKVGELLRLPN